MLRQIVDEDGLRRLIFLQDRFQRRALGSLIGEHAGVEAMSEQLLGAHGLPFVHEIGEDHDIGVIAQ